MVGSEPETEFKEEVAFLELKSIVASLVLVVENVGESLVVVA